MEILNYLFYGAIAIVPILIWLYFFRFCLPKKKSYIVITFIAGMISVLPIKLYEKYASTAIGFLEHLNLFRYLSDLLMIQSLDSLLSYTLATIIVFCLLFIFTGFLLFFLEVLSGDNTVEVYKKKIIKGLESPGLFISIGTACGVVAYFTSLSLSQTVWLFLMVGILEEFIKHLVLRFSDEFKIHSVSESIQYSIIIALGFAFVENVLYFSSVASMNIFSLEEFAVLVFFRSILSVAAHITFSSVLGYFYGVAKFSSKLYQKEVLENQHPVLEMFHKIFHIKGSVLFHEQKLLEGVFISMVLHGVFNALLEFGHTKWSFLYIFILFLLILYILNHWKRMEKQGILT